MAPKGDGGDKAAASAGDVELATKGDAPEPEAGNGSGELAKKPADDHKEEYGLLHLAFCFCGIMGSFVCYGMVMEHATSGGNKLHEFSLIISPPLPSTLWWRCSASTSPQSLPPTCPKLQPRLRG